MRCKILTEFFVGFGRDERLKYLRKEAKILGSHFEAQERFSVLFGEGVVAGFRGALVAVAHGSAIDRKGAVLFVVGYRHLHVHALVLVDFADIKFSADFAAIRGR